MNTPKIFQTIKKEVNHQEIANKMNTSVFIYELSNNEQGYCFIADLQPSNKWLLPTGEIVDVVKLVKIIEPETTGHHNINRFFKGRYAEKLSEELVALMTDRYTNVRYTIDKKYSSKFGMLYKVTLINLTDQQLEEINREF